MRPLSVAALPLVCGLIFACQQTPISAPLPDPVQLKQRALENFKKSEQNLEKYSCVVHRHEEQLEADGSVKRSHRETEEQFFVNGIEIDHLLAKDGKDLPAGAAAKEQQRVDKEVKKYSDSGVAEKTKLEDYRQAEMFLRALQFIDGQRQMRDGRSTIVYMLSGDPSFHPHSVEERFAQALSGRIWVDEESGMPVELNVETVRDVKLGGGLLANVHKGFRLHLVQTRYPDGVWLMKSVDGTGDARAALFFHPRFRFSEQLEGCHLFSVNTNETIQTPETDRPKIPKNP